MIFFFSIRFKKQDSNTIQTTESPLQNQLIENVLFIRYALKGNYHPFHSVNFKKYSHQISNKTVFICRLDKQVKMP